MIFFANKSSFEKDEKIYKCEDHAMLRFVLFTDNAIQVLTN